MRLAVDGGCNVRDFWDLSMAEILIYVDVAHGRLTSSRELAAWQLAFVANAMGAKPKVTVDALLGRGKSKVLSGAAADTALLALMGATRPASTATVAKG